jgi:glyoxylase-like metal-dependent hydrolase (beta-lactamase superfamily II)
MGSDTPQTEEVADDIVRIALPKREGLPAPVSADNNVYLLDGEAPALINAGHPAQFESLTKAVQSIDRPVDIGAIERIVHTSWSVETLAGAKNFPEVDHFVASDDMVEPRRYASIVEDRRRQLFNFADGLLDEEPFADKDRGDLEAFAERYYPALPDEIDFIPLRSGHVVRAGERRLEVIGSPGPTPGHVCLYENDDKILFTGDFTLSGMPDQIDDVQSYFVSLERLVELDSERLLPNRGRVRRRGKWTLKNAHRFINNFMSHAPEAMFDEPTLGEFVYQDWGRVPEDFAEVVLKAEIYRKLLDELVRSRMIEAKGQGLERKYGTDVEDPREEVRQGGPSPPE